MMFVCDTCCRFVQVNSDILEYFRSNKVSTRHSHTLPPSFTHTHTHRPQRSPFDPTLSIC